MSKSAIVILRQQWAEASPLAPAVVDEVAARVTQEQGQRAASMVASDVRMQVLPHPFDPVRIRAVGRQEVEADASSVSRERSRRCDAGVDDVVVEDDVDATCVGVLAGDEVEKVAEQRGALVLEARGVEGAGVDVERASPRCQDSCRLRLMTPGA